MKKTIGRIILCLICCIVLIVAVSASAFGDNGDAQVIASGEGEGAYYKLGDDTPVPGSSVAAYDGNGFFYCYMTDSCRLVGTFLSESGELENTLIIADLSSTSENLSQPSCCAVGDKIYVSWVSGVGENGNGRLYIKRVDRLGNMSASAELCATDVYVRRPGLATDGSGIMVSYRCIDSHTGLSNIYAAYVTDTGSSFEKSEAWHLGVGYYPSVAYAANTGRFLVAWQQSNYCVNGVILTKAGIVGETKLLIDYTDSYLQQVRLASDGNGFCVCAYSYDGIYSNLLTADGSSTGNTKLIIPAEGAFSGSICYDGARYLMTYSKDSPLSYYGDLPDHRLSDAYAVYLDPLTGEPDRSGTVGIATGWWHQFHVQCILGGDGRKFFTYLSDKGNGHTTMRWMLTSGENSVCTASFSEKEYAVSGSRSCDNVYCGDSDGKTAYLINGGNVSRITPYNSWTSLSGAHTYTNVFDCDMLDSEHVYAATWGGQSLWLNRSGDGYTFNSWGGCDDLPCLGICAIDEETVYTCTGDGRIYSRISDHPWQSVVYQAADGVDLHDIAGSAKDNIYAVGDRGTVVHYDGARWSVIPTGVISALNAVWVDSTGAAWIAGDSGCVLHIADGKCSRVASPVDSELYGVWGLYDDMIFFCGDTGLAAVYDGKSWSRIQTGTNEAILCVFGIVEEKNCVLYICEPASSRLAVAEIPIVSDQWVPPPPYEPDRGSLTVEPGLSASDTISVVGALSGADVYIDGELVGVTPIYDHPVGSGKHSVSIALRGYNTLSCDNVSGGDRLTARLTAELFPEEYIDNLKRVSVSDASSLSAAVEEAMNDESDTWYLIRLSEDSGDFYFDELKIDRRGKLTICGAEGTWLCGTINVLTSDVRLTGINFNYISSDKAFFHIKPGDKDTAAYTVEHFYVTDSSFSYSFENGLAPCGYKGYAGTEYGGAGTVTVKDFVVSGNSFKHSELFSFVGAGDEDYNIMDGYYVCANTFTDCGIGMLAADAHTYYVYSGTIDFSHEEIGFCEHNILRNVLVSGNSISMTRNAPNNYKNIIAISCANLGNSDNLLENVEVRHNLSRTSGTEKNEFSSVSISNVSVADGYSGKEYDSFITPALTHTDRNTARNIVLRENDFELGVSRGLNITNVCVDVGEQCGRDNSMTDVRIVDNLISSSYGMRAANYAGGTDSGICLDNSFSDILISGNHLLRYSRSYYDTGILVCGCYISQHGHLTDTAPRYTGSMSKVNVLNNTVESYADGIVIAGAAGDYSTGQVLSDVTVSGNTVKTANLAPYPVFDTGITVAGSVMQTIGEGDCAHIANRDCVVENVTVSDNSVTARIGINVSGMFVSNSVSSPSTGNRANNVSVTNNALKARVGSKSDDLPSSGIVTADVIDPMCNISKGTLGMLEAVYACNAEGIEVSGNKFSGFGKDELLYADLVRKPAAWEWVPGDENKLARGSDQELALFAWFDSYNPSVPGDVNGDGTVSALDLLRLKKHLSGLSVEIDTSAADVNGDGNVSALDLLRLKKYLSGIPVVLE